jgi:signal transduction histidine kinase/CheY-like chemotaxis protein
MLITIGIGYALITVKMVDLWFLFKKMMIYLVILILLFVINTPLVIFMIQLNIQGSYLWGVLAFALVVSFLFHNLFRSKIETFFSNKFFGKKELHNAIQISNSKITNSLYKKKFSQSILETVGSVFQIRKVFVKLRSKTCHYDGLLKKKAFNENKWDIHVKKEKERSDVFLNYFAKDFERSKTIIDKAEIEKKIDMHRSLSQEEIDIYHELNNHGYSLVLPVLSYVPFGGYILIGDKTSGNLFDSEELKVLDQLVKSIELSLQTIESVEIIKDHEKRIEQELEKTTRIEALVLLAGNIAHNFNNVLTGILGNIGFAKMETEEGKIIESLDNAEHAAFRAAELSNQLLTFSKGGEPRKQMTSIIEIVKTAAYSMLRETNIKCEFSIPIDLWIIEIDQMQLSQVIKMMIQNAIDAMSDKGKITIECENFIKTDKANLPCPDGNYIKIAIVDQGKGIKDEDLPRIFDPFFTTKQFGTGGGLGLTTCNSIIKKHNGLIDVQSELNIGTTFTIYLPAAGKEKVTIEIGEEGKNVEYLKTENSKGKILAMDDEIYVLQLLGRLLNFGHYDAVLVKNGEGAIEAYKEAMKKDEPFDAVVLDMIVNNGMGGAETIKELLKIDPNVKAIISSGYSDDELVVNHKKYGFQASVEKPYEPKTMNETIDGILTKKT